MLSQVIDIFNDYYSSELTVPKIDKKLKIKRDSFPTR